jgi:hypothetical protein
LSNGLDNYNVTSCEGDELFNYNTHIDDEEEIVEKYNKENPDKKIKICNLLFLSKESSESDNLGGASKSVSSYEDKNHLMYIIDFKKFTKCHVCPKCGNYCISASNKGCYNKKLFERHVAKCTGKSVPNLRANKVSIPDVPHFTKNKLYAYLFARGRKNEYPFIDNFITFDFETCKDPVNKDVTEKIYCEAALRIANEARTTVLGEDIKTDATFIWENSEIDFINNLFNNLFKDAKKIYNDRLERIDALGLTEKERKDLKGT